VKSIVKPFSTYLASALFAGTVMAAVSVDEAAKLKSTLTPVGAEKAGNKDGTIPAWTGGLTTSPSGFKNGGRRPDPFATDVLMYSITPKNLAQHADKLTDGTKAMLEKYPETFRVDVYPTRRTFAAPQWFYEKTFKNATLSKTVEGGAGPRAEVAPGGVPFPIPKNGVEVMLNHQRAWAPENMHEVAKNFTVSSNGQSVMVSHYENYFSRPFNGQDFDPSEGQWRMKVRTTNLGPAIRAGESIISHFNDDESKTQTWIYLTGQRRVRKLPNSCCDTPTPFSAGIISFDELGTFLGDMSRFDWKLLGKKEVVVPYNSNRTMVPPKTADVIKGRHLNPDHVRWELHRVWVVEATLKEGKRHTSARSRYYIDEDSWMAILGDRWDAKGTLARVVYSIPIVMPDVPAVFRSSFGVYDLVNGTSYIGSLYNEESEQMRIDKPFSASTFSPEAMAGEGIR